MCEYVVYVRASYSFCASLPLTHANLPALPVAPIPSGAPRITRSNSIPTNDMVFDLYGTSPLGSTMSLADRPKSMMRSGSFRDREPADDCETASTCKIPVYRYIIPFLWLATMAPFLRLVPFGLSVYYWGPQLIKLNSGNELKFQLSFECVKVFLLAEYILGNLNIPLMFQAPA